jgi:uncharacterized protein
MQPTLHDDQAGPTPTAQRIATLDVVRGFALLGIGLMNVEFFSRPLQGLALGFDDSLAGADRNVAWAVMTFVQGKFWTLFALLFGAGFALTVVRSDAHSDAFMTRYVRRLAALLLIGLAHALLLWAGDILVTYALTGVILLAFAQMRSKTLFALGIASYLVPFVFVWMIAGVLQIAALDPEAGAAITAEIGNEAAKLRADYESAAAVYRNGSYLDVTMQRVRDSLMQYGWLTMLMPAILGAFLLGMGLMRSGALRDPAAHRSLFRRLLLIGGSLGALLAVLASRLLIGGDMTLPTPAVALGSTLMGIGSLLLSLAYLSAIVLLLHGPWPGIRHWLAPVGRMALSNYLLQSLVFSSLFYGYGAGAWGAVSRSEQIPLVLALFLLQMVLSHWWLQRFHFGPVEWLWRAATYLRRPAMRR